ncbi:MAG TPA: rhodanese-like domain-containing protein [Ignavibacteriales bacterium]|nr:rhodanese-like domain-containing protein [Ignavibacteriales bacterium]
MFGNTASNIDSFDLNAEAFYSKYKENGGHVLLDVRTPEEFESGHIEGAININIIDPLFRAEVEKLDNAKTYFVYCRSGNRSYTACKEMKRLGIDKVFNLEDGLLGWDKPLVTE